ncbi:TPA: hypothetical protein OGU99_000606 [Escherichia coli]|nr:hypothetical protein [Escherichia coli]
MTTYEVLESVVADLAFEKKPFDVIYSTDYRDTFLNSPQEEKDKLIATYHEAWKYYRQWEKEEKASTIRGLNNLV